MIQVLMSILEVRKELLIGITLSVLYLTYYLVEVVKVPEVVCGDGELMEALRSVAVLRARYWPTAWCVEGRAQTVLGSLLRSWWLRAPAFVRRLVRLRDGGTLALDWLAEGERLSAPRAVLVVLPGLTGGAHADYVRCLAGAAGLLRARLVVVNYRGLGGAPLTSPRLYCAVSHADVAEALEAVAAEARGAPLLGAGVSLGGLVLGQYLAAHGARARLQAALIVSSPLDVVRGMECMESAPLNALLSWRCAVALRRVVASHARLLAGGGGAGVGARESECDWRGLSRVRSVRAFDAAFTARHFGFESVEAYYRAATLRDKLALVRAPLLCLCAADDPFQPCGVLPRREARASARAALAVTARGGHIGFLEGLWPAGAAHTQFVARLAHQYFDALLQRPSLLLHADADADADL